MEVVDGGGVAAEKLDMGHFCGWRWSAPPQRAMEGGHRVVSSFFLFYERVHTLILDVISPLNI